MAAGAASLWSCGAPSVSSPDSSEDGRTRDGPDSVVVDPDVANGAELCEEVLRPGVDFDDWPVACIAEDRVRIYPVVVFECRDGRRLKINDYAFQYEDEEIVIDPGSAELFRSCLPE